MGSGEKLEIWMAVTWRFACSQNGCFDYVFVQSQKPILEGKRIPYDFLYHSDVNFVGSKSKIKNTILWIGISFGPVSVFNSKNPLELIKWAKLSFFSIISPSHCWIYNLCPPYCSFYGAENNRGPNPWCLPISTLLCK